jgi:sec-independent protein translocase protein TatA
MLNLPRGSELIIILFLALLLFGRGRIGSVFSELGKGLRDFRRSVKGEDTEINKDEGKEGSSTDKKD